MILLSGKHAAGDQRGYFIHGGATPRTFTECPYGRGALPYVKSSVNSYQEASEATGRCFLNDENFDRSM